MMVSSYTSWARPAASSAAVCRQKSRAWPGGRPRPAIAPDSVAARARSWRIARWVTTIEVRSGSGPQLSWPGAGIACVARTEPGPANWRQACRKFAASLRGWHATGGSAFVSEVPVIGIQLLGPLAVTVDGVPVGVGGPRQRCVLARLIVAHGQVVSADRLIEDLYAGEAPPKALAAVQSYVSHLRRALEPGRAAWDRAGVLAARAARCARCGGPGPGSPKTSASPPARPCASWKKTPSPRPPSCPPRRPARRGRARRP